jgi:hypothetical protein
MREFRSAVTGNRNDADDHVSALVPASEASVPEPARRAV